MQCSVLPTAEAHPLQWAERPACGFPVLVSLIWDIGQQNPMRSGAGRNINSLLIKVTEGGVDLGAGWEVGRCWRGRTRRSQEKSGLLVCARSLLSAYSVHAVMPSFQRAVALAVPIGAGGGSGGNGGWCRLCAWAGSVSLCPENPPWPPLVAKHKQSWCSLPSCIQNMMTLSSSKLKVSEYIMVLIHVHQHD